MGWYVQYDGAVTGPHEDEVIHRGLRDGHLTKASLVSRSASGPFAMLGSVREIVGDPDPAAERAEVEREVAGFRNKPTDWTLNWFIAQWVLLVAGVALILVSRAERSFGAFVTGLVLLFVSGIIKIVRRWRP
jgi:hypothetical protein